MRHFRYSHLLLLLFIGSLAACTTTKDGFSYRVFHNTTARYNGFFYAQESMKDVNRKLKENHEENYDEVLPVFLFVEEGNEDLVNEETERIIQKTQKVISLHKMEVPRRGRKKIKRPEMNKWIDDNYLLLGQGYFYKRNLYKAEEFFLFVSRKYEEDNINAQANNWLARCYIEQGRFNKALSALAVAAKQKNLDDEVIAETNLIYTDLLIRKEDYKEAAKKLQAAIPHIKKKRDRARPTFILAQLNQKLGQSEQAISLYQSVVKMKPEYELVFYSKINQAMAFNRRDGNSSEIRESLYKMIKDEKNLEYQDQIYYALAEMSLEERDREQGIELLEMSVKTSVDNQKQKAKSFLRLADLYFEDREYALAQAYYDSTATNLDKEHPRYDKVFNMAESLTDLVTNLYTIELQDSLAEYCSLSTEERVKKLLKVQRQLEKDMEQKRFEDEQALIDQMNEANNDNSSGEGQFWVYNPFLKEIGMNNFVSYWGERPLEDNWRRSNKLPTFTEGSETTETENEDEVYLPEDKYRVPTIEEMLEDLPCSTDQQMYSDSLIAAAYYNNGLIYKEKLDDFDNGIDSWESLVTNYDDSEYHVLAFYQLYRSFYKKEQEGYTNFGCLTCSSRYWADIISDRYPGSEWEMLVKNPNYLVGKSMKEADELKEYEMVYGWYNDRDYIDVITFTTALLDSVDDNHLECKYRILKAQAIGHMDGMTGQRENYIAELQSVPKKCPGSEEAETAKEILAAITGQTAELPNDSKGKKEDKTESKGDDEGPFEYAPMTKHYMAVIVPSKEEHGISVNEMKEDISDYNKNNFASSNLKITSNLFGREYQIILVKTFQTADEGKLYMQSFKSNETTLKNVNAEGFEIVLVSKDNYLTIFKERNLLDYIDFYKENYTE